MRQDKKTKVWYYDFRFEGVRYRGSTKTANKRLADLYEKQIRDEIYQTVILGIDTTKRVGDAIIEFLREYDATSNHKRNYKIQRMHYQKVFAFLIEKIGDIPLAKVQQRELSKLAVDMRQERTAATVNNFFTVINKLFRKCVEDWKWLTVAPKVKLFVKDNKIVRFISRDEANILVALLPKHLGKIAEFTLQTGLRWSNVSKLKWKQVYIEQQCLIIEGYYMKNGKPLYVPLNQTAVSLIEGEHGRNNEYVFTTPKGTPYRDKPSSTSWAKALIKAGIKKFRWHDLRHTWASWHIQKGTPINKLMELGGWSDISMVLRYAHLSKEHLHEVVK